VRCTLPLFALLCVAFAPAPFPKAKPDRQTDLEKLQGDWDLVSETYRGQTHTRKMTAVIYKDSLALVTKDWTSRYRFTLDPKAKPPTIDMRLAGDSHRMHAVYRLRGDVLTICYHMANRDTPPKELTDKDRNHCVLVFRRAE
jgi:uncharacterized protein (TIGR03067 family)